MSTLDIRFEPLAGYPDPTPAYKRRDLPREEEFSREYEAILERLEEELTHLEAEDVIIQTAHRDVDIRPDGWPKGQARKPPFPGVVLWFTAKARRGSRMIGPQRHSLDSHHDWKDNLQALMLRLEALRAVDRYGGEYGGEQYYGYSERPPFPTRTQSTPSSSPNSTPNSTRGKRQQAAELLLTVAGYQAVPESIAKLVQSRDVAREVGRIAAGKAHPDGGGDAALFIQVQNARELLRAR